MNGGMVPTSFGKLSLRYLISALLAFVLISAGANAQENPALEKYLEQVEERSASQGMIFGNADGEVTVYKFFDYNCPYCRRATTFMDEMIADYPEVKMVVIDNAALGKSSAETAIGMSQLSPELRRKAHYAAQSGGRRNAQWMIDYATANGETIVDPTNTENPKVAAISKDLAFNSAFSRALGFKGVPAFIIGGKRIGGFDTTSIEKELCGYSGLGSCKNSSRIMLADADFLVNRGDPEAAKSYYARAADLALPTNNAGHLNSICWRGAKSGNAQSILASCERAVSLKQNIANYRGSRGLARALTGNREGAIADIEYWIAHNSDNVKQENAIAVRKKMIAALRANDDTAIMLLVAEM